jgi:hypothetical protein
MHHWPHVTRRGDATHLAASAAVLAGLVAVAAVPWFSVGFL